LDALVDILVELPVSDTTQAIHIEAVKCVMAILSSQLYHDNVMNSSIFFAYLMRGKCSSRAMELTKALLTNYLQRNTPYFKKREKEPESIVLGLA
uniref:Dymeclin n=1 Tax=Anisakis simplex TaxID=6269 RepID=A0A0M3JEM3_ANISI